MHPGPTDTDANPADGPNAEMIAGFTAVGRYAEAGRDRGHCRPPRGDQAGGVSEIGQQLGPGMTDYPVAVSRDDELGARPGSVHAESAFLLG